MEKEAIEIETPSIKLQQLLKWGGITETGGEAKDFIQDGLVLVNGQVCTQRGKQIHPGEVVRIADELELTVSEKKNGR